MIEHQGTYQEETRTKLSRNVTIEREMLSKSIQNIEYNSTSVNLSCQQEYSSTNIKLYSIPPPHILSNIKHQFILTARIAG